MASQNSGRAPLAAPTFQQFAVPTGGNAGRLPNIPGHAITITARCPGGQVIYLGRNADGLANIPAADANGNKSVAMKDGMSFSYEVNNANVFAANATGAGAFLHIQAGIYTGV